MTLKTEEFSIEEFKAQFQSQDIDDADYVLHQIPLEKIEEYCSLEEMEAYGKRVARAVSQGGFEFSRAGFYFDDIPSGDLKKSYEDALAKGFNHGFFEVLGESIHYSTFILSGMIRGNGWDESHLFIERIFSNEDIQKISQAFIDMEEAGESDPNHFTYGHFLNFISRQQMYGDAFKNRRAAVPVEHVEKYIPMARFDQPEDIIRFVAASPKHAHLISEEFFTETLRDSMESAQPGSASTFWESMMKSKQTKTWFEEYTPKIFHEMAEKSILEDDYFDLARLVRFLPSGLLRVLPVEDVEKVASACAQSPKEGIKYAEIFAAAVKNKKLIACFTAEQVAAVAERLTTFPPKENFRDGIRSAHNEYDFDFGKTVDDQLSAFSELVTRAHEYGLADKIATDAFNRAAIVYECGNDMNAVWDVDGASKLRPAFRTALVQGVLDLGNYRKSHAGLVAYDSGKDEFIYAPKV